MASTRLINNTEEKLCYIPCNFCNFVLAVSVPCNKVSDIVKVRCGRCTSLWYVNTGMVAGFNHYRPSSTSQDSSFSSLHDQDLKKTSTNFRADVGSSSRYIPMKPNSLAIINDKKTVNHTPEKRKRVPSVYNQFIKQEIQRVKANDSNISHREAFSAAAKNWAHYPHIQMLEAKNHQEKDDEESCMQGSNKRSKSKADSFHI